MKIGILQAMAALSLLAADLTKISEDGNITPVELIVTAMDLCRQVGINVDKNNISKIISTVELLDSWKSKKTTAVTDAELLELGGSICAIFNLTRVG